MRTIRDMVMEKFIQKEINIISGKIVDEISSMQNNLAHDIATAEDGERSESLKQKYKKLNDLYISVAINSTCADVSVDELMSMGISVDRIVREVVTA